MRMVKILTLVAAIFIVVQASAADYPERSVSVIVPFPPGGASDVTARLVTAKLAERVGQSVVVENRPGANGALGAAALKQAPADGYTLLIGSIGVFAINPALFKDLRYDPQKDFDLLSVIVRTPNVLVAHPTFPGQHRCRADRLSEEKSRQGDLRVVRDRLVRSSYGCAVLAADRHDRHSRALQGWRTCHQ